MAIKEARHAAGKYTPADATEIVQNSGQPVHRPIVVLGDAETLDGRVKLLNGHSGVDGIHSLATSDSRMIELIDAVNRTNSILLHIEQHLAVGSDEAFTDADLNTDHKE